MRLDEIAHRLGLALRGPGEIEIRGVCGLEEAGEHDLSFLANPRYLPLLATTRAGAVILGPEEREAAVPLLVSPHPYLSFAQAVELFHPPQPPPPGIHPSAVIADSARLGESCSIGAHVVVGAEAVVGRDAVLHPQVTLYPRVSIGDRFLAHSGAVVREGCRIGDRVILHNGAVIGADGFGFAPRDDGSFHKIVQAGIVVLEDDVEIGANTCVDRPAVGETRIGAGTKLDNLVQIAHGVRVGRHSVFAAQVGIAGSTRLGDHVMLGGQVGVAGHLEIGDRVAATGDTAIFRSVEAGRRVSGNPEMDSRLWARIAVLLRGLPDLARTVKRLQRRIEELESKLDSG